MKMNLRPRCRDWLPLTTQQLRLRNLVRIKGVNIEVNSNENDGKEILVYYTLHSSKDTEAFYKSEALPQRHLQQKWADIECSDMLKSTANCVCIKVWIHWNHGNNDDRDDEARNDGHDDDVNDGGSDDDDSDKEESKVAKLKNSESETKEPINALKRQIANTCLSPYKLPRPPDQLLFTWGVYFSGLVALNHENTKCKPNSLIFCLNDAEFASPKHLTNESLCEQLYSLSLPNMSSCQENTNEFFINSPPVSRSSSPTNFDMEENLVTMIKTRYMQLSASIWDVKNSYNLKKLLLLQEYQRRSIQTRKESENFVNDIKYLCLHCITTKELTKKLRTTSLTNYHHSHHSMGRALSNLLAEYQEIDPKALYKGRQLMKEIETLKYRKEILEREYETMSDKLDSKRQTLIELINARMKLQIYLKKRFQALKDELSHMPLYYKDYKDKKEKKIHLVQSVEKKRVSLCMELSEIYPIGHNGNSHTICGIPFPNVDAYVDNNKFINSIGAESVPPTALNAAFGYLAHLVQMIAVIMNRPLRNLIIYEGSRTRIKNIIEYPLYTRSLLPSQPVRHALYLLSQNIAQLSYDITDRWSKSTIENILNIFSKLSELRKNHSDGHHSIASTTIADDTSKLQYNGNCNISSNDFLMDSSSSVDMNHESPSLSVPLPLNKLSPYLQMLPSNSSPVPILNSNNITHHRICRSVGSYSDSEEDVSNILDQFYSNSDSNIPFQTDEAF